MTIAKILAAMSLSLTAKGKHQQSPQHAGLLLPLGFWFAMPNNSETRGRKPLSFADRVANVPLRLYPHEIDQIRELAEREGISAMAWKQRQIRAGLLPAGSP